MTKMKMPLVHDIKNPKYELLNIIKIFRVLDFQVSESFFKAVFEL
jgi:hypothetical protein